jgi:hypothetical protein
LLSSCGTSVSLSHRPRLLHFSTPEVSGGWGTGSMNVTASRAEPRYVFGRINELHTTSENQISSTQESIQTDSSYVNLNAWVGLLDNLDFYIDLQGVAGVKLQLLGASKQAKEKGVKFSIETRMVKGFSTSNSNSTSVDGIFGDNSQAKVSANISVLDISGNIGYRYNSQMLVYINTFLNKNNFSGKLWYDADNIFRTVSTSSESYGTLLGFQYTPDSDIFYTLEAGITKTIWLDRGSTWAYPFGFSYGRMW